MTAPAINYDLSKLPRELHRHYIAASDEDIQAMLKRIGLKSLDELFQHIPESVRFAEAPALPDELEYSDLLKRMQQLSEKNKSVISFIGDGLPAYKVHPIVPHVASLRKLTTAYTPYQPERSQGTLMSHWIYQCLMAQLTGFEAINASLYERSSALFEAVCCTLRLSRKADTVIVSEGCYPGDIEVLKTLTADQGAIIETVPVNAETGRTSTKRLKQKILELGDRCAAIAFPQVNHLGLLEEVNELSDLADEHGLLSIAVIDPMLIATGGLKPPSEYGKTGADILVGEAQHLAIGANFGGPGLGVFGVRHGENMPNHLRATPGRFVGKAKDVAGRECLVQVLSTREQHIRKEKATSNICSNQAFLATMAGASILARGEKGMEAACEAGHNLALSAAAELLTLDGVALAYPKIPFYNELTLKLSKPVTKLLAEARKEGIHLGINVSSRLGDSKDSLLKLTFTDTNSDHDVEKLANFFKAHFKQGKDKNYDVPIPPKELRRLDPVGLPQVDAEEVKDAYNRMAELNISPDDTCYPLGSCTMKYNPYANDWAANLPGFTDAHPQAPTEDVQGCLEILYETQEWFKKITGLAGVTTQPLAGAQGELVGLKLFQAYHREHSKTKRDVILIPKSAHGTNFATAAMAGFVNKKVDGKQVGIVLLEADEGGIIDQADLDAKIAEYGERISGIMVTNPNTGGIFETAFKDIADKIHNAGGLVYMDGANMNAICGWVDLGKMGVDAVHNNLHKTWSIPHGGGGPGDGIVAVSEKLLDYLPGYQIEKHDDRFVPVRPPKCIGSFHRHWGNFAHKVRCYTYLLRLGREGVRRISAVSVLAARYLHAELGNEFPSLPQGADNVPRMHEFILTLTEDDFAKLEAAGVARAQAIPRVGKMFLDYGFHSPTVAFPEVYGLMIEPTETYSKAELDRFAEAVRAIHSLVQEKPELLRNTPYFTPIDRVDEVGANRQPALSEKLTGLPEIPENRINPTDLINMPVKEITAKLKAIETAAVAG